MTCPDGFTNHESAKDYETFLYRLCGGCWALVETINGGDTSLRRPLLERFLLNSVHVVDKAEIAADPDSERIQLAFGAVGPTAVIDDYNRALRIRSDVFSPEERTCVGAIRDALVSSLNVLALNPCEVRSQLVARLAAVRENKLVQAFMDSLVTTAKRPWLCPLVGDFSLRRGIELRTVKRHGSMVTSLSVSSDGKRAVSGSKDGVVEVWNADSGELHKTLRAHTTAIADVDISHDGLTAVSASMDGSFILWDLQTYQPIRTIEAASPILAVALRADGKQAISSHAPLLAPGLARRVGSVIGSWLRSPGNWQSCISQLIVWDLETGRTVRTLAGHADPFVYHLALNREGDLAASGSPQSLKVWDLRTGNELGDLEGHVTGLAITPDNRLVFVADGIAGVWNIAERGKARCLVSGNVSEIAVSHDGSCAALKMADEGLIKLFDLSLENEFGMLDGPSNSVTTLAIANCEMNSRPETALTRIVSASATEKVLRFWDVPAEGRSTSVGELNRDWLGPLRSVAISRDGRVAVRGNKGLQVWNAGERRVERTLEQANERINYGCLALDARGDRLIVADNVGHLTVWDVERGKGYPLTARVDGTVYSDEPAYSVAISCDGRIGYSTGIDSIDIWDIGQNRHLRRLGGTWGTLFQRGESAILHALTVSPDGRWGISIHAKDSPCVWDMNAGTKKCRLDGHSAQVYAVTIAPDGNTALTASADQSIKVWEFRSGRQIRTLEGHTDDVLDVAVSPDGKWAVSASLDHTIRVWEIERAQCVVKFTGDFAFICCDTGGAGTVAAGDGSGGFFLVQLVMPDSL
jgi:WD40 repeat protein